MWFPRLAFVAWTLLPWLGCLSSGGSDSANPDQLPPAPAGARGYPSRAEDLDAWPGFRQPPPGYGEVAFFWWIGDPLTRERLTWELDQLAGHSVSGLQINYAHSDRGGRSYGLTYPSEPPLFSEAWWDLFRWFLGECRRRGIAASLSDYTLCAPGQGWWTDEIIREHPDLRGARLEGTNRAAAGGQELRWPLPPGVLSIHAIPAPTPTPTATATATPTVPVDLRAAVVDGELRWTPADGVWRVQAVRATPVPLSLDPMHPASGARYLEHFFQRFEDRNPGEAGRGLNFFFSDELDLGVNGRLWNDRFAAEFRRRKGYDLLPELPALFTDVGPRTPKVRLDYADVAVALAEEGFFRPIFDWHRSRGMVFGCDHGGRGRDVVEFGDYFRTQRWMTGPGNDSPMLSADVVKNKVASSIAHLYERPRTWLEGFHSSGWGTTSAQVADATFRNFVAGHNLLTLHGLYYSTHGGFWEWAPPCNHFRLPYWRHFGEFLRCSERLSYLLSQGVHRCDIAVLYPVAPVEAGLDGDAAVRTAFEVGPALFRQGLDFDFMDFESLARATITNRELHVAGESYRVLVLPAMRAVRQSTIEKALAFHRGGGVVVVVGALPEASDRVGRNDPELDAAVREMFGADVRAAVRASSTGPVASAAGGQGWRVGTAEAVVSVVERMQPADFARVGGQGERLPAQVLHRRVGPRDVFLVLGVPRGGECWFRARGRVELWDPWTGEARPLFATGSEADGTRVHLPGEPFEPQLVVFTPDPAPTIVTGVDPADSLDRVELSGSPTVRILSAKAGPKRVTIARGGTTTVFEGLATAAPPALELNGAWEFELAPTLDNRWGDFRLPATTNLLGAEARQFRYAVGDSERQDWIAPGFDDSAWTKTTCSFGPRFWKLGALPAAAATDDLEARLAALTRVATGEKVTVGGLETSWEEAGFSWRWGPEGDPGHQGWHGLKEKVSDDFIVLGARQWADREFVYRPEPRGTRYYLWTTVRSPEALTARLRIGGMQPTGVWVNGQRLAVAVPSVELREGANAVLLRYDGVGRGHVVFERDGTPPTAKQPLAMSWYRHDTVLPFDAYPADTARVGWYRFVAPPGLKELRCVVEGRVEVWVDGRSVDLHLDERLGGTGGRYRGAVDTVSPGPAVVALRVVHEAGSYAGAAFPEPIELICSAGRLAPGDWAKVGVLETYSGGAWYRRQVTLGAEQVRGRVWLDLGQVVASAEVRVNGEAVGTRVAPPWRFDVSRQVRAGENLIEVLVCNTLANHYVTIPTRYRGETTSGLLGPVRIETQVPAVLSARGGL